jgi:hypothetical protein
MPGPFFDVAFVFRLVRASPPAGQPGRGDG